MTNDVKVAPSVPAQPVKRRRKIASLDRRKARAGWIFVLPFIIGFVLIYLPMLADSVTASFMQQERVDLDPQFVGFDNYIKAFTVYSDSDKVTFLQTLLTGLSALAFDLPAILLFSLFMAVMLNQKMAGRAFFRAIFFMPVVISTGIVAANNANITMMDTSGMDTGAGLEEEEGSGGLINITDIEGLFANMAVGQELVQYVVTMINNIFNIVNRSGVQMLIFLAALQSISPAIYESCKIDGATSWETFWKITFPMISPMILVNAIYTIIDSFTDQSNTVMKYINSAYNLQFEGANGKQVMGANMATAMSWTYFMIVVLIVALITAIMSAFVFYSRKND